MFGSKSSWSTPPPEAFRVAKFDDDSPDCSTPSTSHRCHGRPKMEVAKATEFRLGKLPSSQAGDTPESAGLSRILPFLYLGSQHDALDRDCLQQHQIEYVLNLSVGGPKPDFIDEENFLRIPVNDTPAEKLLPHFDKAFEFLDRVEKANSCALVHCLAGISRSPTLAIAFVMRHLGLRSDEAYRFVKAKRPVISPNFNFLGQLLDFEKRIEVRKRDNSDSSAQVSPPIRPQSDNFSIAARHADSLEAFQVKNMRRSFSAPLKVQKSSDRSALRINLASVSPEQKAGRNNKREMADPLESLSDSIQSASISTGERQKSLTVPIANSNLLALQREQTNVQQSCNEPTSSSSSSELETSCCRSQFSNQDQSDFHHHPCCSSCLKIEVAVEEYHFESNTSVANWTLAESFERHISPVRLNRKVDSTTMELSSTQSTLKSRSPSPSLRGVTVPAQHPTSVENPLFRTAVFRSSLKRLRAAQISPANIQPCRDIRAATEAPADTPSHLKSLKRASWPRGPCLEPFSQLKSPDDGFSDGQFADGYGDPEAKDWGSTGSLEITVS